MELPFDTQPNEIELPCEIIEAPETLCACDSEASTELSSLKGVQTNHVYEHLTSSLGAVFTGKEKPGAVSAQEEAEQKGLVSRKRAVPEGGVSPEHTDYRQPPRVLEWPERYNESLPILLDPYLRAAFLSTQAASWDHFTHGYVDQLINYGVHQFPVSRPSEDIIRAHSKGYCQSSFQLSFLACNLGNLARPMKFGDKKAKHFTGPSMLCRFFLHNGAHIRVILEADKLLECPVLRKEVHDHYLTGIHGEKTHTPSHLRHRSKRRDRNKSASTL